MENKNIELEDRLEKEIEEREEFGICGIVYWG